jgi:hypothetical protein
MKRASIRRILCCTLTLAGLLALPVSARADGKVNKACTLNGKRLWGKIQVVKAFPDLKVQVVRAFPDLKVQKVTAFADGCGKWQFVDAFPDLKIQFVDAFPDLKVEFVSAFPGL